jgi:hypothetical protein
LCVHYTLSATLSEPWLKHFHGTAGDPSAAPRGRGEQPGVRGERARPGPGLRLRRRHLVAAAAGGDPSGAAGAGTGRDGQAQHEQRLHGAPAQGSPELRPRREQHQHRLAVLHVVAQDRAAGGALQGHAGAAGHGRGPALQHGRLPALVLLGWLTASRVLGSSS